jgi:hypothetical protein
MQQLAAAEQLVHDAVPSRAGSHNSIALQKDSVAHLNTTS